jgi:hypothetical protein
MKTSPLPYSGKEIFTIMAEHTLTKNYYKTGVNVCRACFDILDAHVANTYKTAPATAPSTTGWNSTMQPNEIFEQLMSTYGKPTPNTMHQNNLTFIAAYNPKDPPELLFKRCTDCQEIVIIARVPYTAKQLLMNIVDLFTRARIYTHNMDNWERKPDTVKTCANLRPFIQATYQCHLASGVITATQSGYTSNNHFSGLTAAEDVSDNGTAKTIVKSIQTHMANLSATVLLQSTASNNANTSISNASMQQVTVNKAHRNANQMHMLQQFALMTTNWPGVQQFAGQTTGQPAARPQARTQCNFVPQAIPVLPLAQQWGQPRGGGGWGGNRSRNGYGCLNPCNPVQPGAPVPFVGGNQIVPYIPAGIHHPQQ